MCGRYALGIRASLVRYNLQRQGLQVDDAPDDDVARDTFNFPPGAYGLVYRAEVPDGGLRDDADQHPDAEDQGSEQGQQTTNADAGEHKFELKVMKWGLIPFWTKRSPDYGSMLKTINCRDDSLIENKGMWTTMKQRKRCIVVAQGFYEWLKKGPGGKDKVPHFVKRKDGNLMCFAGLWDCVKYEDTEEKLYTYSIITTSSNKQLSFLHDRMPVILEPKSKALETWLDPRRNKWTSELQSVLQPYEGELECYPVNKDVGKVGNNSPDFIIPVDSKQNKHNIMNFFDNASKKQEEKTVDKNANADENSETHAPRPDPEHSMTGSKRKGEDDDTHLNKARKLDTSPLKLTSPSKNVSARKTRSATSNEGMTLKSSPLKKAADGSQQITKFFGGK